jgi:hypothetical protein
MVIPTSGAGTRERAFVQLKTDDRSGLLTDPASSAAFWNPAKRWLFAMRVRKKFRVFISNARSSA